MLREHLQEMTQIQDVSQHPAILEKLSKDYANSIDVLNSPYPLNCYTCLMHVCQFIENENYAICAMRDVYAGSDFAHWLINREGFSEKPLADAAPGDFIFYFHNGEFKHAGILSDKEQVISKWGIGQLYQHNIWELPSSYGNEIRIFTPLSENEAYYLFTLFAEENGIQFL